MLQKFCMLDGEIPQFAYVRVSYGQIFQYFHICKSNKKHFNFLNTYDSGRGIWYWGLAGSSPSPSLTIKSTGSAMPDLLQSAVIRMTLTFLNLLSSGSTSKKFSDITFTPTKYTKSEKESSFWNANYWCYISVIS